MSIQLEKTLAQFHKVAEWKAVTVDDLVWDYAVGGAGSDWLFVIHGGGGDAESMFPYFTALAPHFKLIAPSIPSTLDNMLAITDGLRVIFEREGISRAHIFGPSLGGMIAQVFAAHHPELTGKCILSHTTLPTPELGARMRKARLPLKLMPLGLFRWQTLRSLRNNLKNEIPDITIDESAFWLARFQNAFGNKLGKADILASVDLQVDFYEQTDLTNSFLRSDPERVMVIFHENDPEFGADAAATIQEFYGNAQCHGLPTYGHLGAMIRTDEIIKLIKLHLTE
ncbi:MAG: alpha/beta hydrolase [Chloroflexota bacterium]